jgi:hypothetical protein
MKIIHYKSKLFVCNDQKDQGIVVYDLLSGQFIRRFGQYLSHVQHICILDDMVFLCRGLEIHPFSKQGKNIELPWNIPQRAWIHQMCAWNNYLFFAGGYKGVFYSTTNGHLLEHIKSINNENIHAMSVAVDDENMFIQTINKIYICTPKGKYIQTFQLRNLIVFPCLQLTSRYMFYYTNNCYELQVFQRTNNWYVTEITTRKRTLDFCILHDMGCIATLCQDGSIDFYHLTTKTNRVCVCDIS